MSANAFMEETVTISDGRLKGIHLTEHRALAWLGIPYAKPPAGQLRWKAPREAEPWEDVLCVREYKNSSVQWLENEAGGNEDCLYLNIWRPEHNEAGLPVLVYLHGGGNIAGSGQDFQGSRLAVSTDSIVLTINYRLGAMGFFRHPALRTGDPLDDSGNYGLLDILHALKWVQKNINYFGGNPGNITLAGQSAGARNALAAYLSPLSRGLFHKLYLMSGSLTTAAAEQGEAYANDLLAALLSDDGTAASAAEAEEWLAQQSAEAIADYLYSRNAGQFAGMIRDTGIRMGVFPHLFEDGTVIPEGGFGRLNAQEHPVLPFVLGSTAGEFTGFALADSRFSGLVQADGRLSGNTGLEQLYAAAVHYGNGLYAAFNAEQTAERLTAAIPGVPVFAYRFGWGLQEGVTDADYRLLLGAPHGADIAFYTGAFEGNYPEGVITGHNEPGRRELSALMCSYLRHFLSTGNPNSEERPGWPQWTGSTDTAEILALDATAQKAALHTVTRLIPEDICSAMEADGSLTSEQRSWITRRLFAGRFFWNAHDGYI
ncbi:carboxylesterase family protein [Paenibacillus camerounensis]|uniref:carboxylesterase family protein n=1 Tax=Paenibacillus camerounensis TaxID=1243663 RepID=UPI000694A8F1|nr:carboxylesterase family protein [Paenibacillus camerounensis]